MRTEIEVRVTAVGMVTDSEKGRKLVAQLNLLLPQLTERPYKPLTVQSLRDVLSYDGNHLFVAQNQAGDVIGAVMLCNGQTILGPNPFLAELVVDGEYRGQGVGRKLVEAVTQKAKELGYPYVMLMSAPERKSANEVYQRCGYEPFPTAVRLKTLG